MLAYQRTREHLFCVRDRDQWLEYLRFHHYEAQVGGQRHRLLHNRLRLQSSDSLPSIMRIHSEVLPQRVH